MSKQTAVEFLAKSLKDFPHIKHSQSFKDLVNQAKAMEKQQSISDYCEGFKASGEGWNGEYGLKDMLDVAGEIDAEDYYNKIYGGDEFPQEESKIKLTQLEFKDAFFGKAKSKGGDNV